MLDLWRSRISLRLGYDWGVLRLPLGLLVVCLAVLCGAPSLGGAAPARKSVCVTAPTDRFEYDGRSYGRVALALPHEGPLATVSIVREVWPCNDTVFPSPTPPPPPVPVLTAVSYTLERLVGIDPQRAIGMAHPGFVWVADSCTASSAMDVGVACLGLDEGSAYRAAQASMSLPYMVANSNGPYPLNGPFPLIFRSSTTCMIQPPPTGPGPQVVPGAVCVHEDGIIRRYPRAPARLGEKLRFVFPIATDSVVVSFGRQAPAILRREGGHFTWPVPASGNYTLTIVARGATPAVQTETTYVLALRVRR